MKPSTRWATACARPRSYGALNRMAARAVHVFKAPYDLARAQAVAQRVLGFMEQHLAERDYLAASHPTIADLACYAYIARAPEGGIPLEPFPAIRAWLVRIEALPRFVPMPQSA